VNRTGPSQNKGAKTVDEIGSQAAMANEKAHVNRTVERIEKKIGIHIGAHLTAPNAASQCGISLLPARPQESPAESGDQVFVGLACGENGGDDAASPTAKNLYQLAHLAAYIGGDGSGIWEVQLFGHAVSKCVGDQRTLIRPPSVNRGFAHTSSPGDIFNREPGKTIFGENLQSAAKDGQPRLLTARTPRRAFASVVLPISRSPSLLAHGLTYHIIE